MVFPRAMLDKTVSPHSYDCSRRFIEIFFFPKPSKQISVFACAPQSRNTIQLDLDLEDGGSAQGSASGCSALMYYCFLPFTRLEARPAPEPIGL